MNDKPDFARRTRNLAKRVVPSCSADGDGVDLCGVRWYLFGHLRRKKYFAKIIRSWSFMIILTQRHRLHRGNAEKREEHTFHFFLFSLPSVVSASLCSAIQETVPIYIQSPPRFKHWCCFMPIKCSNSPCIGKKFTCSSSV